MFSSYLFDDTKYIISSVIQTMLPKQNIIMKAKWNKTDKEILFWCKSTLSTNFPHMFSFMNINLHDLLLYKSK